MNRTFGKAASLLTLCAVAAFALGMLVKSDFLNYFSSMCIAWGFTGMVAALASFAGPDVKASCNAALVFAAVYVTLAMLVYFAQLTLTGLTPGGEAERLLDYKRFGLLFSYDLLGYAFMALATFCIAPAVRAQSRGDRALRLMLRIHGVFAPACVVMPMLHLFHPGMAGGDLMGTLVLEVWCAYFIPVCVLAYRHFARAVDAADKENKC